METRETLVQIAKDTVEKWGSVDEAISKEGGAEGGEKKVREKLAKLRAARIAAQMANVRFAHTSVALRLAPTPSQRVGQRLATAATMALLT